MPFSWTDMSQIEVWERPNFHNSPSISGSLDAGLEAAGLSKTDIDIFDFYSFVIERPGS